MNDSDEKPRARRALGVDVGKVRIGIAVTDELGLMAHPRPPVNGKNPKAAAEQIASLASEEGIDHLVVGLPLELSGDEGPAARRAQAFAERLAATGLTVELFDERFSSTEAERRLGEAGRSSRRAMRPHVDGAAAAVVLQAWIDRR